MHARITLVGRDHRPGVVGRAVIHNDDLEVGKRLTEHRVEGGGQETSVIVRGDHDTDGRGHRVVASKVLKGFLTLDTQKRYFPDGSGGMWSRYSQSNSTS